MLTSDDTHRPKQGRACLRAALVLLRCPVGFASLHIPAGSLSLPSGSKPGAISRWLFK